MTTGRSTRSIADGSVDNTAELCKHLTKQLKQRAIDKRQYDVIKWLIDSGVKFSEDKLLTVLTLDDKCRSLT